jgi:xanthine/CO dehydrogenase XdhC/CoxF family maturation factor
MTQPAPSNPDTSATPILDQAAHWLGEGRDVAIATVIETWGSAPQPVGSQLLIDADGNFEGSVSGGCVEGAVILEAADVIASGKPTVMEFGVADETAWEVGLACGGRIKVYVEPITRD